ncbi:MAG: hypothetical protein SNJ61_11050 [Fimbriimonadaceae bacterium]
MFRRLYWVTEQLYADGRSRVTGIYTSIPDLIDHGLRFVGDDAPKCVGLRLSLVKLDAGHDVLGVWSGDDFKHIADDLAPYVRTHEFNPETVDDLAQILNASAQQLVPA